MAGTILARLWWVRSNNFYLFFSLFGAALLIMPPPPGRRKPELPAARRIILAPGIQFTVIAEIEQDRFGSLKCRRGLFEQFIDPSQFIKFLDVGNFWRRKSFV